MGRNNWKNESESLGCVKKRKCVIECCWIGVFWYWHRKKRIAWAAKNYSSCRGERLGSVSATSVSCGCFSFSERLGKVSFWRWPLTRCCRPRRNMFVMCSSCLNSLSLLTSSHFCMASSSLSLLRFSHLCLLSSILTSCSISLCWRASSRSSASSWRIAMRVSRLESFDHRFCFLSRVPSPAKYGVTREVWYWCHSTVISLTSHCVHFFIFVFTAATTGLSNWMLHPCRRLMLWTDNGGNK